MLFRSRDGVEMGHGANDQDRHRAIDEIQRIGRVVEEKDVGKAEHHAGDHHRQHGEELERRAAGAKALRLFDHISAGEDDKIGRASCRERV